MTGVERARSLFLAGTTYQAFLCCGLAAARGTQPCDLILHPDFDSAEAFVDVLREAGLFDRVVLLPSAKTTSRLRRHAVLCWNTIRSGIEAVAGGYAQVFATSEGRPEDLAALYWSKKRDPATVGYSVEDGAQDYTSEPITQNRPLRNRLAFRLIYGWWWRDVLHRGQARGVDRLLLRLPEALPPVKRGTPVDRIEPEPFHSPAMQRLAVRYLEHTGARAQIAGADGLLLLIRSDKVADPAAYRNAVLGVVREASAAGLRLIVKQHPRERTPDPFGLESEPGLLFLGAESVTELLYVHPEIKLRLIAGDTSGSLLVARWLLPEAAVISFAPLAGIERPEYLRLLAAEGGHVVASLAELGNALRDCKKR